MEGANREAKEKCLTMGGKNRDLESESADRGFSVLYGTKMPGGTVSLSQRGHSCPCYTRRMAAEIKAVLFDIGGVIIRTEDPGPRERLAGCYGMDRTGIDRLVFGSSTAQAAERGQEPESAVWANVQRELSLSAEQLAQFQTEFWAGDRADSSMIHLLAELHSRGIRTGLLTNSWLPDPLPLFWTRYPLAEAEVRAALDVAVSSARIGVQKPAARIYQAALEELGTRAEETVFIDDFPHNIAAARELGLRAILFETAMQAQQDLLALLDA